MGQDTFHLLVVKDLVIPLGRKDRNVKKAPPLT